jgi:hypothetical protein
MVQKLNDARSSKYRQIVMFDNLNGVFSTQEKGMRNLIHEVYAALETVLYLDPHYWLQRAKSILHLSAHDIQQIRIARSYAAKAATELADKTKAHASAVFTLALICGRLCSLNHYSEDAEIEEAIQTYYSALTLTNNEAYIEDQLVKARERGRENDLFNLCAVVVKRTNIVSRYQQQVRHLQSVIRPWRQ